MKQFYILLFALFMLGSCSNVDKLYAEGNDRKLIEKVLKKERKHLAKESEIRLAERSYARLHQDLLDDLSRANESDSEEKWVKIFNIADRIDALQNQIERYSPIRAKNGYTAEFDYVNVDALKEKSGKKAGEYFYNRGLDKLEMAKQMENPRHKAREAYDDFQKVRRYDRSRDVSWPKEQAKNLGTVRVATQVGTQVSIAGFRVVNSGYRNEVERGLEQMVDFSNSGWIERVYGSPFGQDVDYVVSVNLRDVDFSDVRQRRDDQDYSKQIREAVRDANGNTVTDSLGNTIYHYSTIHATVRKTIYEKEAEAEVQVDIVNTKTGRTVFSQRYREDEDYKEETCQISGNDDAVPNSVRCRNQQIDFDDEEEMVEDLLEDMRYRVRNAITHEINRLD